MELKNSEKKMLLTIARRAIERAVLGREETAIYGAEPSDILRTQAGAFVTLEIGEKLRGCVGFVQSKNPLFQTVEEAAVSAALHDNRFNPLSKQELDRVTLEISVLMPMEKVVNAEELVPGRHGLLIEQGYRHGLLLPQVATDYGWDRITFLEQTCVKAGLEKDEWKNPATTIYKFSALVFNEQDTE